MWFWAFVAENVLPVISPERSGVFPLRINFAITLANSDPAPFAGRGSWAPIRLLEPRNDARSFGPMTVPRLVVIRKRAVKRILPRRKPYRYVIASMRRLWIVESTITAPPIFVP